MNIKIHNKFEIFDGTNTYTAYNVMSHNIIDRIITFQPFATYIALGSGSTVSPTSSINYLSSWEASFQTTLEEIQCDISKGDTYVKRTITIPANQYAGLTFSEIGITNTSTANPIIYNYVNVTNENNEVVSVIKKSGQALFIRVTIYLELSSDAQKMLCSGPNNLVKALLGELPNPVIKAIRGENLQPNTSSIYRNVPRTGTPVNCTFNSAISQAGTSATYNINFDLDTGSTAEIIILINGSPVARYSTLGMCNFSEEEKQVSSQNHNTAIVDEFVKNIISVTDSNDNVVSNYVEKKYASDFCDYIANPFEVTISDDNARWVSKDGNRIAFLSGGKLYVYKNQNYSLFKMNNNISTENLTKVIMFEDYLFAIYSALPYIKMFKCENGTYTEISIDLTNYTLFDSGFDWQDIEIISNGATNFTFGIILGQILRRPVVVYASLSNGQLVITNVSYGQSDYICNMFSLYRNSFCDSMIGFITNNYNNTANNYRIEQHYADRTSQVTNEVAAYYLTDGTVSLEGKSRAVIAKKSSAPYIWLYYYPRVFRYSISLTSGVENWISTDLLYLIQKYTGEQTTYKIYSLTDYNNPQEFTLGFPSDIVQANITDFEFVGDTLLIFFDNSVSAINLKQTKTVLENMPDANANYVVTYNKYSLIGTSESEGVSGTFTLEISI